MHRISRAVSTVWNLQKIFAAIPEWYGFSVNITLGDKFNAFAREFLQHGIRKGIPSLFINIKFLYDDSEKVQAIENAVLEFKDSLSSCNKFSQSDETEELPTALMWTLYFASQHFNKLGQYQRALDLINEALTHTPTLVESYMIKARILKVAILDS